MNPKDIVRTGYDRAADAYAEQYGPLSSVRYRDWLEDIARRVPKGGRVLDLGCGNGVPVAQRLATDYRLVGLDISPVQIAKARRAVPTAEFVCGDMSAIEFPARSLAAIVALYSIIHVPLAEQPNLFHRIAQWLEPGGHLLATVGHAEWTGVEERWLGVDGATMYWSHADADAYQGWLADLGFDVLTRQVVQEGASGHTLLLARHVPRAENNGDHAVGSDQSDEVCAGRVKRKTRPGRISDRFRLPFRRETLSLDFSSLQQPHFAYLSAPRKCNDT
jgi:SAM-dependent methyltransferase